MGFLSGIETKIIDWFVASAYQPELVLGMAALIMILTCFGLPVPEEFVVIAVGLCVYIGLHPEQYPPPESGSSSVGFFSAVGVLMASVLIGDSIAYGLGFYIRGHPRRQRWLHRWLDASLLEKASHWMKKGGFWTAAIFRYTPGLRLPGQFSMGLLGVPYFKFLAVIAGAAALGIPTQIYFLSQYGDAVVKLLKTAKEYVVISSFLVLVGLGLLIWMKRKRPATDKR